MVVFTQCLPLRNRRTFIVKIKLNAGARLKRVQNKSMLLESFLLIIQRYKTDYAF